jgi:hypothetical protein
VHAGAAREAGSVDEEGGLVPVLPEQERVQPAAGGDAARRRDEEGHGDPVHPARGRSGVPVVEEQVRVSRLRGHGS